MNWLDKMILAVAPGVALKRERSRAAAVAMRRHYEAAARTPRTDWWHAPRGDANAAVGPALERLRAVIRDLVRNDGWPKRAVAELVEDIVGWGILPKPDGPIPLPALDAWRAWSKSTDCDADGRKNLVGIEAMVVRTVIESGECLVRRRLRRPGDGLVIPMQLQVLEPDFLEITKDGMRGQQGGPIVQGVEFDGIGRRTAYWLFKEHPGSSRISTGGQSQRVDASEILHVFAEERPGQVRGVPWFVAAVRKLEDFGDYDDATLVRQKIAACFAAFVTDPQGNPESVGVEKEGEDDREETLRPGQVRYLNPGESVEFGMPPAVVDENYARRMLHGIAVACGVTYEALTGDYSQVNYSSARMARQSHWRHVLGARERTVIPQFCDPVWRWFGEAAQVAGFATAIPSATWIGPGMGMIDADKEARAVSKLVRVGAMTPSEMVLQQGYDPDEHWPRYKADLDRLDELGIVLDSDPRRVTESGQAQSTGGGPPEEPGEEPEDEPPEAPDEDESDVEEPEEDEEDAAAG